MDIGRNIENNGSRYIKEIQKTCGITGVQIMMYIFGKGSYSSEVADLVERCDKEKKYKFISLDNKRIAILIL